MDAAQGIPQRPKAAERGSAASVSRWGSSSRIRHLKTAYRDLKTRFKGRSKPHIARLKATHDSTPRTIPPQESGSTSGNNVSELVSHAPSYTLSANGSHKGQPNKPIPEPTQLPLEESTMDGNHYSPLQAARGADRSAPKPQQSTAELQSTSVPIAKPESCLDLNGVGSQMNGSEARNGYKGFAEQSPAQVSTKGVITILQTHNGCGADDTAPDGRPLQRALEHSDTFEHHHNGSWSLGTRTSTTTSTSTTMSLESGLTARSSLCTSITTQSSMTPGTPTEEGTVIKRNSMSSNSSSRPNPQFDQTANNRQTPVLPAGANIDSAEGAREIVISLGSSRGGGGDTKSWVKEQCLNRIIIHKDGPGEPFQPGEPLLSKVTPGGVKPACLSIIDEACSDAGCSVHDSSTRSPMEQNKPDLLRVSTSFLHTYDGTSNFAPDSAHSPSAHSKVMGSTAPTSVAEELESDGSEPSEPSEYEASLSEITDDNEEFNEALEGLQLDASLQPLLITLKDCIVFLVQQIVFEWVRTHAPENDADTSSPNLGEGSGSSSGPSGNDGSASQGSGSKRTLSGGRTPGSEKGDGNNRDKRRKTEDSPADEDVKDKIQVFACPFVKRFPEKEWPKGCQRGWSEIHRLKDHLYKSHRQSYYCRRCFSEFSSEETLNQHSRQDCEMIQSPPSIYGLTDGMCLKLRSRRGIQHLSGPEYWSRIYRIIFPDVEDVPDPYFTIRPDIREKLQNNQARAQFQSSLSQEVFRGLQPLVQIPDPREFEAIIARATSMAISNMLGPGTPSSASQTMPMSTTAYEETDQRPESVDQQPLKLDARPNHTSTFDAQRRQLAPKTQFDLLLHIGGVDNSSAITDSINSTSQSLVNANATSGMMEQFQIVHAAQAYNTNIGLEPTDADFPWFEELTYPQQPDNCDYDNS